MPSAPFVQFPINLTAAVEKLDEIARCLHRIGDALDRQSPPPAPSFDNHPYVAQLSDLRRVDPRTVSHLKEHLEVFAENNSVVPNSEAFYAAVKRYEEEVEQVYGEEAVGELPWNKEAGGRIFERDRKRDADLRQAPRENGSAAGEPKAGPAS